MKKLFSPDSPILQILSHMADLMILSLLWLVCSLPLVTMGAATTALYAVLLKVVAGQEVPTVKIFFRKFRENFKQATLLWLIQTVVTAFVVLDVLLVLSGAVGDSLIVAIICCMPAAFLIMAMAYCYPMVAHFQVSTGQTLKNAVLLAMGNLPSSLAMGALNCLPFLLWLLFPRQFYSFAILLILLGPGVLANLNCYLLLRIFRKITPKGTQQDE